MCLPSLHISLGVFFKLFTLFEEDVHHLDVLIALQQRSHGHAGGIGFQKHIDNLHIDNLRIDNLREMDTLYHEADELEDEADFFDDLAIWTTLDHEAVINLSPCESKQEIVEGELQI